MAALRPKTKSVRPPPFVPLNEQEAVLLKDLEFRRATGADVLPVQFQLIQLYSIWAAGDDPSDSFAKGEALLQQVLERHRRGPPVENAIETAARWHDRRGQFSAALAFHQELLAEERVRLGPDHPALASALNNTAQALIALGRFGKARRCLEEALDIKRRAPSVGPAHPSYATSLNELGRIAKEEGRHTDALRLFEEALAIFRASLGPDHRSVGAALTNAAQVLITMGTFARARGLLEEAADITKRQLGEQHPDYATDLNELGRVCEHEGAFSDALAFYARSLAISRAAYGPEHREVAAVLGNMGGAQHAMGDNAAALRSHEEALRITRDVLGPEHPDVGTCLNEIGQVYEVSAAARSIQAPVHLFAGSGRLGQGA